MASPKDLLNECVNLANIVFSHMRKVKFNQIMCLVLGTLYLEAVGVLEHGIFRQGFSMDPRYVTALVELRRVMLCGRKLVTEWTQKDWWMSVITSSDSASVLQKVALHLGEFHECVKVLIQIKMKWMVHPDLHPWNEDEFVKVLLQLKFIMMGEDPTADFVPEHFRGDIDSLISRIEEYKIGMFSRPKFVKLADCLLEKLQARISNHGHPYVIDISRDVEILYDHNLGSGSFANVFKCQFLGVMAAAKVFHTNCIDVEKEAKLFSELQHPNVVQFIGYGVKGCQSVIVSELMSKDLRTYLVDEKKNAGQGPPLPLLVAINIMLQVAEAMNYLHEMGVMHRDLKATNVLINVLENQDGLLSSTSVQAKLTDFGESKGKLHGSRYTTQMVGTTRWRAPEVFEDEANREKYTKSADVYSFAMLFFEVLTGEIPFADIGSTMVLQSIRDEIRPPLPHVDYCPGYLSALIQKCWATNPAEHPQFPKISQLLLCCKNLILMHACPSPQSFFMHFNVTGKGHFEYPNSYLYSLKKFVSIHGKPCIPGWGLSEDWKFSFGVSSLDAKVKIGNKIAIIDGQIIACFGLPGSGVEDYWLLDLFEDLLMHPHFLDDPKLAIVETYKQVDQILWEKGNSQHVVASSKACMCVLVGDHLLVANVGDSRAVICTYGEAWTLSTDHTPYQAQIEDPGPVVRYNHWLVGGGSGVPQFEQNVVTEPEIQEVTIEEGVDFLVLGTTGLWSVVSNQDAVTMAEYMPDAEKAANRLVEEAYRRGSLDDVTCVIVRFHHDA
ncbi:hypothetical protein CY35_04G014500 [Sphagnum magellanicum]|nr:hypothetical protein CY35_04G014500 [Sphagnum magellanicum]